MYKVCSSLTFVLDDESVTVLASGSFVNLSSSFAVMMSPLSMLIEKITHEKGTKVVLSFRMLISPSSSRPELLRKTTAVAGVEKSHPIMQNNPKMRIAISTLEAIDDAI
jgi:hypothetical protein